MTGLRGKRVLLTGATGGLGWHAALAFAEAGATVEALDLHPEKGRALQEAAGPSLFYTDADLRDGRTLAARLAEVISARGSIDVVVNNAAIYPAKRFEDYSLEEYREVQAVNVEGAIACVKACLPGMKAKRSGRIVNIASITFYGGWANLYPYVASKAALVGLTRAWAREFGPDGVTANAISVGAIPTDAEKIHPDPAGYNQWVLDQQSLKRRGTPADVANVTLFLAADASAFMTGQLLNVDGGWVMH